jgi:hypothetical protein
MTVATLITAAKTRSPGNSEMITKKEAQGIVKAASSPADVALIKAIQPADLTSAAAKVIQKFLATAPNTGGTGGVTPTQDVKLELRATHKVWTCTYWPMAGNLNRPDGDPEEHLWAKGGVLEKFDEVLKARGKKTGALAYEKRPYFNYLIGSDDDAGWYIPSAMIREDDAERTTGVDLNGDGKITANVKHDFITGDHLGEKDGKTNGSYNTDWFGNCDKVAAAGTMFHEPKKAVTMDGVTFTPNQIKGLLVLIVDSQMRGADFKMARYNGSPDVVRTTDGRTLRGTIQGLDLKDFRAGNFSSSGNKVTRLDYDKPITITLLNGNKETIPVEKQVSLTRESQEDSAAVFHETLKSWLGDKRPFCMDYDQGPHVWNDSFDGANITESQKLPPGVNPNHLNGEKGAYSGGKLTFVKTEVLQGSTVSKRYSYWMEEKNGKVVNSGWLGSNVPDFMWRPKAETPSWTGKNERNPFVDPALVKEIYLKSI